MFYSIFCCLKNKSELFVCVSLVFLCFCSKHCVCCSFVVCVLCFSFRMFVRSGLIDLYLFGVFLIEVAKRKK